MSVLPPLLWLQMVEKCRRILCVGFFCLVSIVIAIETIVNLWPQYYALRSARIVLLQLQQQWASQPKLSTPKNTSAPKDFKLLLNELTELAQAQGLQFQILDDATAETATVQLIGQYPALALWQKMAVENFSSELVWVSQTMVPAPDFLQLRLEVRVRRLLNPLSAISVRTLSKDTIRNPFDPMTGHFFQETSLRQYPLQELKMVGTWQDGDQIWGLLETPEQHILMVTDGEIVGEEGQEVVRVAADHLEFK